MKTKVVIHEEEEFLDLFTVRDINGSIVEFPDEPDVKNGFNSYNSAETCAVLNGYEVVESFNL